MKISIQILAKLTTAVLILATGLSTTFAMGNLWELKLAEESNLWLEGDSTLHGFESEATVIKLDTEIRFSGNPQGERIAAILEKEDNKPKVAELVLRVPVKDMKSGIVGLASRLRKTLKYEKHPDIVFRMDGYTVTEAAEGKDVYKITANGTLSLAGEEREVSLDMTARQNDEHITIEGEKKLLMTDFGVKPPSLMFGAIKTDDEIIVHWDLKLNIEEKEEGRLADTDSAI